MRKISLPTETDGNSPPFRFEGRMHLFTSIGRPLKISKWDHQLRTWDSANVAVTTLVHQAIWKESAWVDSDGTVFGWYRHEPAGRDEAWHLTAPKIGAVVSFDGGNTVHDLGFLLGSGDPLDPDAKNGAFLGVEYTEATRSPHPLCGPQCQSSRTGCSASQDRKT